MTLAESIVHAVLDDLGGLIDDSDRVFEDVQVRLVRVVQDTLDKQFTVVERLMQALTEMRARRFASDNGDVAREFSLAITAAEDAAMRYTRGRAVELGVFKPADLDRREAIEERHEWTGNALRAMDEE